MPPAVHMGKYAAGPISHSSCHPSLSCFSNLRICLFRELTSETKCSLVCSCRNSQTSQGDHLSRDELLESCLASKAYITRAVCHPAGESARPIDLVEIAGELESPQIASYILTKILQAIASYRCTTNPKRRSRGMTFFGCDGAGARPYL
jgi:hypothetical protein